MLDEQLTPEQIDELLDAAVAAPSMTWLTPADPASRTW
ncbi:hypothetical protein FB561_5783 [Kribbella amoyensis]|uniref:Uncharacterized protein n=1 Tax=Kribbella amoyensis TaxID=996641 RepID=A0A561C0I2_9ACTN|nr:hypothetical protein FB561_5783 [Kribbella amoyensis]